MVKKTLRSLRVKADADDEKYNLDNHLIFKLQQSLKFAVDDKNKTVSFNFDFDAARTAAGDIAKAAIESFLNDYTLMFYIVDEGLLIKDVTQPGDRKVLIKPEGVFVDLSPAGRDHLIGILKQIPDGPEIDEETGEPWLEQDSFTLAAAEIHRE